MAADGKWIPGLTPEMPVEQAAQRALQLRLEVVRNRLKLSLLEPDKDPEYVHQLRVGTRRTAAALSIFRACVPKKTFRKARKYLRTLRRAAGDAREWDVVLEELKLRREQQPSVERPGLDFLMAYAMAHRSMAQHRLAQESPEDPDDFEEFFSETLAALQAPDPPLTLGGLARPILIDLLHELDQAASRDLKIMDNLHEVRIIGKRLRYAMELFVDCYERPFREELYPAVESMQDILGAANDSHVMSRWLSELCKKLKEALPSEWKCWRPGIDGLLQYHRHRLPQLRRRFVKWWTNWKSVGTDVTLAHLLRKPLNGEGPEADRGTPFRLDPRPGVVR